MAQSAFVTDTSKRSTKTWAQGLVTLFIGLTIAHLGVSLFLLSNLGPDTFTIFIQGISNQVGRSIGTCHVAALVLLIVLMAIFTRQYVKPGTVVCAFCGGWIIDLFNWLLAPLGQTDSMVARAVIMLAGCVILSIGMSVVIASDSGTGPNDLIAIISTDLISRKRKVSFRIVRVSWDVLFTVLGIALGGVFGAGTITAALLTGPLVQFFLPRSRAVIHRIFPNVA